VKLRHGSRVHDVVRKSASTFAVDGAPVEASFTRLDGTRGEGIKADSRVRVIVARQGDRVFAQIGGRAYDLRVVSRVAAAAGDHQAAGGLEAPMPGRVTRVAVKVGDAVKRGQELIVVEAMKMENAITAPADGVVKSLTVRVGDMVSPGSALIEVS